MTFAYDTDLQVKKCQCDFTDLTYDTHLQIKQTQCDLDLGTDLQVEKSLCDLDLQAIFNKPIVLVQ